MAFLDAWERFPAPDHPAGEAMANVVATCAQLERKLIEPRTRDVLTVKHAQGQRLGRPSTLPTARPWQGRAQWLRSGSLTGST